MRFLKFSIVGAVGGVVDMFVLYLLVDRFPLSLPLWSCKTVAALLAMASNFIINDRWTFRDCRCKGGERKQAFRFLRFIIICCIGLGIAIATLYALNFRLGINLYIANAIAILTAAGWNFSASSRFAWNTNSSPTKNFDKNESHK